VSAHVPLVAGHWLSLLQAWPLVLHLPACGQSFWVRHSVEPSVQSPLPQSPADAQAFPAGLLQVPIVRQFTALMHALPFFAPEAASHVPSFCGHWADELQLLLNVHLDAPGKPLQSLFARQGLALSWHRPTLHVPLLRAGQLALLVHDVTLSLQVPLVPVQVEAEKQASPAGFAHVPGQSWSWRQVAPPTWQLPDAGQSPLLVHAWFVLLQWPPRIAQSPTFEQTVPVVLQVPIAGHCALDVQLAPLMLQAPGCCGHWASLVQLALVMLHVPGSGVHTGGAQLVVAVHGFSGSGGAVLQPRGLYVTEQTCGWQVCVPGRLHVCANGPLQLWALVLHAWLVPLQVCALEPVHLPPLHDGEM
jgi:hypothetical protein